MDEEQEAEKNAGNKEALQSQNDENTEEINEEEFQKTIYKDESRLEVMESDYTKLADGMHDDFEKLVENDPSSYFTEDELEILETGSSLSEKNKIFRVAFEKYRDEELNLKKEEMDTFGKELEGNKRKLDFVSAQNKFSRENPKVDMKALAEFIQEDLTPRRRKVLQEESEGDKSKFLTLIYSDYKKQIGETDEEEELPTNLDGVNGESDSKLEGLDSMGREKYLKSIGA